MCSCLVISPYNLLTCFSFLWSSGHIKVTFRKRFLFFIFGCAGPWFRARAFSSCGERGLLSVAVRGLLLLWSMDSRVCRFRELWHMSLAHSCPKACGILVPGSGIQPMSPALTGGFLTTGLQSKPQSKIYCILNNDEVVASYQ